MSIDRLRARAPSARCIGAYTLQDHQLRFHKIGKDGSAKCDAFHTGLAGDLVEGVLFDLHPADVGALDGAEGLGRGYEKKRVDVFKPAGVHLTFAAMNYDFAILG